MKAKKIDTGTVDISARRELIVHPKPIVSGTSTKKALGGFSLVELIVVITILVILGTIAFINLGGFASSARDGRRVSDMSNITQAIELSVVTQGSAPMPTDTKPYTGGNVTIQMGTITNATIPRMSGDFSDPVTKAPYNYSVFGNGLYYQIGIDFENPLSFTPSTFGRGLGGGLIETVYADSGVKYSKLSGSYKFDPSLPSLFFLTGAQNTASGGIFSPDVCFVLNNVSTNTFGSTSGCKTKKDMNLKDMDSSLVGYWDMETLTGTMLKDLSGNGNHGTFSGGMVASTALTGGIVGKGMSFDGVNTFISVPDSVSILPTSSYTMQISAKKNGTGSQGERGIMVSKNTNYIDVCVPSLNNQILYSLYGSGAQPLVTGGKCPNLGDWHIYTASFNGAKAMLYDNGIKIGSKDVSLVEDNTGALTIGRYNLGGYYFNGVIDDIKIYNRALSDDEIKQQAKIAGL